MSQNQSRRKAQATRPRRRRRAQVERPMSNLMAMVSGVHGYKSGAKWPDTDSSPSVAFSTLTTTGNLTVGGDAYIRVYPQNVENLYYDSPTTGGGVVTSWGAGSDASSAASIISSFSAVRLVSASIILVYTGDNFHNSGLITCMETSTDVHVTTTPPLDPSASAPLKSFGRFSGGVAITCRRNSLEAAHYRDPTTSGSDLDGWANYCIFVQGANTAEPQGYELMIVQNWEGLPIPGDITSNLATPAAPDAPGVRAKVSNMLRNADPTMYGKLADAALNALGHGANATLGALGYGAGVAGVYGVARLSSNHLPRLTL